MIAPVVSSVLPATPVQPGVQGAVSTGAGLGGFEALLAALTPGASDPAGARSEDATVKAADEEPGPAAEPDPGLMGGFVLTSLFVPPPPVLVPQGQSITVTTTEPGPGPVAGSSAPAAATPLVPNPRSPAEPVQDLASQADGDLGLSDLGPDPLETPLSGPEPQVHPGAARPEPAARQAAPPPAAAPAQTPIQAQTAIPPQALPAAAELLPLPTTAPAAAVTEAAAESTDPVVATTGEPKVAEARGSAQEPTRAADGAVPGQDGLRPATRPQQGQGDPGSGREGDRQPDTGTAAPAVRAEADTGAPAPASRNDIAAPAPVVVAAHGTLADQVRAAPHTVAHMAEQIIRKVEGQTTRFDIQLDPLGLGQVDVRIEIGADGQLKAAMSFETQNAANELQARSGELKRALEDAGFNLGGGLSFEVSRDPSGSGRDLAQQNPQQQQAQQDNRSGGRAFQAAMDRADAPVELVRPGEIYLQRRTLSGIDVRI